MLQRLFFPLAVEPPSGLGEIVELPLGLSYFCGKVIVFQIYIIVDSLISYQGLCL